LTERVSAGHDAGAARAGLDQGRLAREIAVTRRSAAEITEELVGGPANIDKGPRVLGATARSVAAGSSWARRSPSSSTRSDARRPPPKIAQRSWNAKAGWRRSGNRSRTSE